MLEKFKKTAKKLFGSDASSPKDPLDSLSDVLKQQVEDNKVMRAAAKQAKAQVDEMARHMQELQAMATGSDNIGFLPGSAQEKLAQAQAMIEQERREAFLKNGGVVSVETENPVKAMRPLRFKSGTTGVTA